MVLLGVLYSIPDLLLELSHPDTAATLLILQFPLCCAEIDLKGLRGMHGHCPDKMISRDCICILHHGRRGERRKDGSEVGN